MMYPPMRELLEKVDNRYTLVVETATRALQLVDGAPAQLKNDSEKPVSNAIREINEGKIRYEQRYEGFK